MARLFDGMKPEDAARIMKDLGDEHVKQILLSVKKRQAAKILSALDPDRAARILR
jgi:flagellar motility protein MotE (MotC chaperone)